MDSSFMRARCLAVGMALCGMGGWSEVWAEGSANPAPAPAPAPAPPPPANQAVAPADEADGPSPPAADKSAPWDALPQATAADLEIDMLMLLTDQKTSPLSVLKDDVWIPDPNQASAASANKNKIKSPPPVEDPSAKYKPREPPKPTKKEVEKKVYTNKVMLVPFRLLGTHGFRVSNPPVGPTSGRFIAWYIPQSNEGKEPKGIPAAAPPKDRDGKAPAAAQTQAGPGGDKGVQNAAGAPPPGAPRFASAFAVTPDGRIHWEVERFFNSMTLTSGASLLNKEDFYVMSLDRGRLQKLAPPPYVAPPPQAAFPPREKDEPLQFYMDRKNQAAAQYKAKVAESRKKHDDSVSLYRSVQEQVGSLPARFSMKAPSVVYAMYYVREQPPPAKVYPGYAPASANPDRVFAGFAEGPWTVSDLLWSALVDFSQSNAKIPKKPGIADPAKDAGKNPAKAVADAAEYKAYQDKIGMVSSMLDSKHPAAFRAASVAVARSGMLNDLEAGSPAFLLAEKVITGPDTWAREKVMRSLLDANISAGKAILMGKAAARPGESGISREMQIAALRIMLRAADANTDAKRVAVVVRALSDPQGAPPADILDEWLKMQEKLWNAGGGSAKTPLEETAKDVLLAFNPADIAPDARRTQTLTAVLAASGNSPLAALLVDKCLLGSSPGLAAQTLEVLVAMADGKQPASLPLYSPSHRVIACLSSPDKDVRSKAWKALSLFEVRPLPGPAAAPANPKPGASAPQLSGLFQRLMDETAGIKPTPPELAPFLARQAVRDLYRPAALSALVRVLAGEDAAASKQAADFLSGPALAPTLVVTLASAAPDVRMKSVAAFYAARGVSMPLPAGAVLDEQLSDALTRWFYGLIAKDQLPAAAQWLAQIPQDAPLLDWVMSQDPVLARGGASVLAYREGADEATASAVIKSMLAKPYKLRAQVQRDWAECQDFIFMENVRKIDGHYTVRMATFARGAADWRETAPSPVTLKWSDNAVSLGVKGVSMAPVAGKKVLELSEVALLDRVNSKMRRELNLGGMSGPVEFSWKAPHWEAELHPDADHVILIRLGPEGLAQKLEIPVLADPSKPAAKKK